MASSSNTTTATATTSSFAKYSYPSEFNVLDFVPKRELSERNYQNWRTLMHNFILRRGMIGFIGGTAEAPPAKTVSVASPDADTSGGAMISHGDTKIIDNLEYMSWKRSDSLVHGWILATLTEDIHLRVLDVETAREVWTTLEEMFDPTEYLFKLDNDTEQRVAHYLPLYIATTNGDWDIANRTIENEPNVVRTTITPFKETMLMLAVYMPSSVRRHHFVRKLLENMSPEDVAIADDENMTALHTAANVGNIVAVKMLVNKNMNLPKVLDKEGNFPLNYAAARGDREMVLYLWDITGKEFILANEYSGAALLRHLTHGELYDIALTLLQLKPELACMEPSPFDIIVEKLSSFPSGTFFNFWQNLIYLGVPMKSGGIANSHSGGNLENPTKCCISVRNKLHSMLWEVTEKLVPMIKHIRQKKMIHHHALELLKFLCKEVAKSTNIRQVERIFKPALQKATRVGIPEIIEEIIVSYPLALFLMNRDDRHIFQYAIMWRREHVFNLVYQLGCPWRFIGRKDISGNNGLHLAGHLGHHQQTNLRASATGAVLQMQRELQWFKEVEKFAIPESKEKRNKDGKTPAEVFTATHQELIKEGEKWMKDTATSCTIVAALIATMVFAATITVPGGNNNENGHPLLSKQKAFKIFGVSDALALFSSITSVLMFLLILTSRYSEQDFLYILPKRLVTGLITLFVSILSTMVAFGAILYLVFGGNKAWVLIPVVALACVPVTLFGALQFPLLVEMIQSTYGKGIFGKRSDRMLE